LRLRGPSGAKDEFLLAATAQNLRKLAKLIPFPAPVYATRGGEVRLCLADRRRSRISRSGNYILDVGRPNVYRVGFRLGRGDAAPDIESEVTPARIEAGVEALGGFDPEYEAISEAAIRIYRSMERSRKHRTSSGQSSA
jgi:hypothetical protein